MAMVFNSDPNTCGFYDLDFEAIEKRQCNNFQAKWGLAREESALQTGHFIMKKGDLDDRFCIKPYTMKRFNQPIERVTWYNKHYMAFQLTNQVVIYKDMLFHMKVDTVFPHAEHEFFKKNADKVNIHRNAFDLALSSDGQQTYKIVYLTKEKREVSPSVVKGSNIKEVEKSSQTKNMIVVKDLVGSMDDLHITPEWSIQEFKLNKTATQLVVLSQDGMYLFVYSLLDFKGNEKPLQKFYFEKRPCFLMHSL